MAAYSLINKSAEKRAKYPHELGWAGNPMPYAVLLALTIAGAFYYNYKYNNITLEKKPTEAG